MLSDADLERIEEMAREEVALDESGMRREGAYPFEPEDVLSMVVELRERRAPGPRIDEVKDQLANLTARIDQLKAEQANAPVDTGRWAEEPVVGDIPRDRSFYRPTEEVDAAGALLHYTLLDGEQWWTINHSSSRITPLELADDLEAASRIIRAHERGSA